MNAMKAPCPLCDQDAVYDTIQQPYGKRFTCEHCSEFFIDASSEAYIGEMVEVFRTEQRKKLQAMAKSCAAPNLFVIRAPRADEIHGDGRSVALETMISSCVSWDR